MRQIIDTQTDRNNSRSQAKAAELSDKKLSDSHADKTATKAAELFNTNRLVVIEISGNPFGG